jgi:ankyrin repeat protein
MWDLWQMNLCTHIEASNAKGQSLLIIGAKTNNHELVKTAIAHKANLNKTDNDGKTALDIAKEKHNLSIVDLLEKAQRNQKHFSTAS